MSSVDDKYKPVHELLPPVLHGKYITLEPLSLLHLDELIIAAQDGELWKLWYTTVPSPETMKDVICSLLYAQTQGSMLPFAVIHNRTKKPVGMTAYLNISMANRRVEIGHTWYRKSLQKTVVNTEAKLLLLTHAFELMNCIAVEFRTHQFNTSSRRAIERLGAKLDGILRNHMIMPNGTLRDTCVYSITKEEWLTVKAHLHYLYNNLLLSSAL
ncbi:MAG: GNAT family protein [Legionella sp.]|nr:GNAT family protein [Legionella sp.]